MKVEGPVLNHSGHIPQRKNISVYYIQYSLTTINTI